MAKRKLSGTKLRQFIRNFHQSELTPSQAKTKLSEISARLISRLDGDIKCYESETEGIIFTTEDGILNLDNAVHFFSDPFLK